MPMNARDGLTGSVRLRFEPHDLWVGVFWRWYHATPATRIGVGWGLSLYVCVVPMLPVCVSVYWLRGQRYAAEHP